MTSRIMRRFMTLVEGVAVNRLVRKPTSFTEVLGMAGRISSNEVANLPQYSDSEVFGRTVRPNDNPNFLDFVVPNVPDQFVLYTSFGRFLVDPQGHNYARYVGAVAADDAASPAMAPSEKRPVDFRSITSDIAGRSSRS